MAATRDGVNAFVGGAGKARTSSPPTYEPVAVEQDDTPDVPDVTDVQARVEAATVPEVLALVERGEITRDEALDAEAAGKGRTTLLDALEDDG
jgi:hypothetical protein